MIWPRGRSHKPETIERLRKIRKESGLIPPDCKFVTNGIENKFVPDYDIDKYVAAGWWVGYSKATRKAYEKMLKDILEE